MYHAECKCKGNSLLQSLQQKHKSVPIANANDDLQDSKRATALEVTIAMMPLLVPQL
jgi:hypothetical protein